MATPEPTSPAAGRKRIDSVSKLAQSVHSVTQPLVAATETVLSSDAPPGFVAAAADISSHAPTPGEMREGSFGENGWQREQGGRSRSTSRPGNVSRGGRPQDRELEGRGGLQAFPPLMEEVSRVAAVEAGKPAAMEVQTYSLEAEPAAKEAQTRSVEIVPVGRAETPPNEPTSPRLQPVERPVQPLSQHRKVSVSGYIPPVKTPWTKSARIGLKAFWRWIWTPFGFFVTLYGLNVIAWGGMLFLLLINAAPAMCYFHDPESHALVRECDHIDSPRRQWIEIDSQILNALFCVTGFGLMPWRFRDLYYLLTYRCRSERKHGRERKLYGLRKLAGHYRAWFRLPGSQTLDHLSTGEYERSLSSTSTTKPSPRAIESARPSQPITEDLRLPLPPHKTPPQPPPGAPRAPPTPLWKLDLFIACQITATLFQICLSGLMWGFTRYDRPSWATGLFIALASCIAGVGGIVSYTEGRRVSRVEGGAAGGKLRRTSVAGSILGAEADGNFDEDGKRGIA